MAWHALSSTVLEDVARLIVSSAQGMWRIGRVLDGEQHVRAALIVMNDVCRNVVDRRYRSVFFCVAKTRPDDGDRVTDFGPNV